MSESFEWRGVVRDGADEKRKWIRQKTEVCKKCGLPGHRAKTCGRPKPDRDLNARELRCGNCGELGHNRMTCKSEANHEYIAARHRSNHSGKTRCSRCGGNDHNVARCTQVEVTRADRFCADCGAIRFTSHHSGFDKGDVCKACHLKRKAAKPRPCSACGIEFVPKDPHRAARTKTCSEECRRAAIAKAQEGKFERLTGQTFGWWTVTAQATARTCAVQCRCGFETLVAASNLRNGTSGSCRSCAAKRRFEEMSDEKRNERLVLARAERNRNTLGAHKIRPGEMPKQATLRRREGRRRLINEYKRKPCLDCGGTFPPVCMDFDHRPGEVKVEGVSKMAIKCASLDAIILEIQKCDLVCSNCHRVRTYQRMLDEQGLEDVSGGLLIEKEQEI